MPHPVAYWQNIIIRRIRIRINVNVLRSFSNIQILSTLKQMDVVILLILLAPKQQCVHS